MGIQEESLKMKVVIFSAFLISLAVSGFVPREPTKQDIDIARIEFSKLGKSSMHNFKVVASEDTTEDNNDHGDDLDEANDTIPIVVGAVLAAMILVMMVSYFVLRVRANKKAS